MCSGDTVCSRSKLGLSCSTHLQYFKNHRVSVSLLWPQIMKRCRKIEHIWNATLLKENDPAPQKGIKGPVNNTACLASAFVKGSMTANLFRHRPFKDRTINQNWNSALFECWCTQHSNPSCLFLPNLLHQSGVKHKVRVLGFLSADLVSVLWLWLCCDYVITSDNWHTQDNVVNQTSGINELIKKFLKRSCGWKYKEMLILISQLDPAPKYQQQHIIAALSAQSPSVERLLTKPWLSEADGVYFWEKERHVIPLQDPAEAQESCFEGTRLQTASVINTFRPISLVLIYWSQQVSRSDCSIFDLTDGTISLLI